MTDMPKRQAIEVRTEVNQIPKNQLFPGPIFEVLFIFIALLSITFMKRRKYAEQIFNLHLH